MAICPYCGSQIGDAAEICGFCGGRLAPAPAPEEIARELPVEESDYEGIPDDILGSMLGSLFGQPAAPAVAEAVEAPVIEETVEVPVIAEAVEAPVIAEAVEAPVIEEAVEAPAVEKAAEAPAVEERPAAPAAEPPASRNVYAQPAQAKKNGWMLPAAIIAVLALIGILFFASRGGTKSDDPNLGVYRATAMEISGMQIDPDTAFEQGFTIELKKHGACEISVDGEKGKGTWTLEDGEITIDDGRNTTSGTLSDGVIKITDMLSTGLNIELKKQE